MAKISTINRIAPSNDKKFANGQVNIEPAAPAARISFRATPKGAKAFGKSIGIDLPTTPGTSARLSGLTALWLGPDEWLVIDEKRSIEALMPKRQNREFSAVDVSHRNTAYLIAGAGAADAINAACPRNLSLASFSVGAASRSIFGKAEIVLLRTGKTSFRMECWRSFAPYVWDLLIDASKDSHV
jgi:sarcosine oxidase subunit gamma